VQIVLTVAVALAVVMACVVNVVASGEPGGPGRRTR
jgi:hypothetical protein